MLYPASPAGCAQPQMTSSTSPGSRPATLASSACTIVAPRSSGRQSTSEPLLARPIGRAGGGDDDGFHAGPPGLGPTERPAPDVVGKTLCRGRGRHPTAVVPGRLRADRRTWSPARRAASTSATSARGTVSGTSLYRVAGFRPARGRGHPRHREGRARPAARRDRPPGAGCVRRRRRGDRPQLVTVPAGRRWAGHRARARRAARERVAGRGAAARSARWWDAGSARPAWVASSPRSRSPRCSRSPTGATARSRASRIAVPMLVKRVVGNSRPAPGDGRSPGRVYLHRLLFDHDPAAGTQGLS